MKKSKAHRTAAAAERLRELYDRRGYVRVPDAARRRSETWQTYSAGYELRFNARNRSELKEIRSLLRVAGIDAGRHYRTFGGYALPIYGASRVLRVILDLGLKPKPPHRGPSSGDRSAPRGSTPAAGRPPRPVFWPLAAGAIANRSQQKVVMRLADKGPLTARELSAAGSQLAHLRRYGIVAALPREGRGPRVWALTPKGIREIQRWRRAQVWY